MLFFFMSQKAEIIIKINHSKIAKFLFIQNLKKTNQHVLGLFPCNNHPIGFKIADPSAVIIYLLLRIIMEEAKHQAVTLNLQEILKRSLEESVALARRRIRSKKGIAQLQAILIDYRQNEELAAIILQVIRLISQHELSRHEQAEQPKETVTLDQYYNLECSLQKFEGSVREHIKNEQQLKIYCEDLQQKNRQLEKSNEELLKSTKIMITNLKRDNQRLIEENSALSAKLKERELKGTEAKDNKEQPLISSIKKARKLIQSFQGSKTYREESALSNLGERLDESAKAKRSSLSSIRINK